MNYESYQIQVRNNTNNTILLDTREKDKTIYLLGNNNVTYSVDEIYLKVESLLYSTFNLKFNRMYNTNIIDKSITFTNIIPNIEEYEKVTNKNEYTNTKTIIVEL